jgi:hypothetical protein
MSHLSHLLQFNCSNNMKGQVKLWICLLCNFLQSPLSSSRWCKHVKLAACRLHAALFSVLYSLTQLSFKCMSNSYLYVAVLYFSQIKWKGVSLKFPFVYSCGKVEEWKIYPELKLGISKSRQLCFSLPMWWPPEQSPVFQAALSRHWVWHACYDVYVFHFEFIPIQNKIAVLYTWIFSF